MSVVYYKFAHFSESMNFDILGDQQNTITKVNLLNKVLGIVAGVLLIDHEVRRKEFQQVPYHRYDECRNFLFVFMRLYII